MNKLHWSFVLSCLLLPSLYAAEQPDIIYVDGKPVYIKGVNMDPKVASRNATAQQEAARSNIPGDIYRGKVLGQDPVYERRTSGDIYRGTIFGATQQDYPSDTLGGKGISKTKLLYDTSLVRAVKMQDFDRVRTLIYANVDVNEPNYAGITPLAFAAETGNLSILKLLVEEGAASINTASSYGVTPLMAAAAGGHTEAVAYLLQHGADPEAKDDLGQTALLHGMNHNNKALTETLVSIQNRAINLPDNEGNTPLMHAAKSGSVDNIKVLLKHKADPNYQNPVTGLTALSVAASQGHAKAANALLSRGADTDMQNKQGRTALFYAAQQGQTALMRQLLKKNANILLLDNDGKTVLSAAAEAGSVPAIEFLIPDYFDINAVDANGMTALMYAAAVPQVDTLVWLINNGADTDMQNKEGDTALMYAIKNKNEKTALLLIQQNASLIATNKQGESVYNLVDIYMPNSPVAMILKVKQNTLYKQQQQALKETRAEATRQADTFINEKLAEINQLQAQLDEEENMIRQLQEEQEQALRQQQEPDAELNESNAQPATQNTEQED